jgi:DNA-binding CsgD family transcriptional regulator
MDRWPAILEVMSFASIKEYDMAILFYNYCYPRRIIARALSLNTSSVLKYISNNNKKLKDKGV